MKTPKTNNKGEKRKPITVDDVLTRKYYSFMSRTIKLMLGKKYPQFVEEYLQAVLTNKKRHGLIITDAMKKAYARIADPKAHYTITTFCKQYACNDIKTLGRIIHVFSKEEAASAKS